nr:hypothetical protein CFP56_46007 [Quercus suber]
MFQFFFKPNPFYILSRWAGRDSHGLSIWFNGARKDVEEQERWKLLSLSVACGFLGDGDANRCRWRFACSTGVCFAGRRVELHQESSAFGFQV